MDRNAPPADPTHPAIAERSLETGERSTSPAKLRQVAEALGIPAEALMPSALPLDNRARILAENAEALEIFSSITDPASRQQGLAYLRWIAAQDAAR